MQKISVNNIFSPHESYEQVTGPQLKMQLNMGLLGLAGVQMLS